MKVELLLGKTKPDERDYIKKMLRGSPDVIEHLVEVILKKYKENTYITDYDSPSWPYFQADRNGYNRAIKEISEMLISISKEE